MSWYGLRRRWAARGRNASEWTTTAAAASIFPSESLARGTCSTAATPARDSCSGEQSSIQFRVTTVGREFDGGAGSLRWCIVALDLALVPLIAVVVGWCN